ncbi:E3 ubiquitin-protein ligase TRIM71-like [Dysidea avara]|uniref:E3 ubiquitin-protein ligase TRIM71-like n=1 Tax=Dysidea avara TaxID=196820 RepID=UPI0033344C33
MAAKDEGTTCTTNNLNCSLCTKFLKILKHRSQVGSPAKCDDCGGDKPFVALCIDCTQCLCRVCYDYHSNKNSTHDILQLDETTQSEPHSSAAVVMDVHSQQHKVLYCSKHTQQELGYYCETCDKMICHSCKMSDHDGHIHITSEMAVTKRQDELTKMIAPVEKMSESLLNAEDDIVAMKGKLQKQAKEIGEMIDKCHKEQHTKLNEQIAKLNKQIAKVNEEIVKVNDRHQQLKKELEEALSLKNKALTAQLEEIKSVQNQLVDLKVLKSTIEEIPGHEIFSKRRQEVERSIQKVSDTCKILDTSPVETDTMTFDPCSESSINLGKLYTNKNPSHLTGQAPKYFIQNQKTSFRILAKTTKGQQCTKGGDQVHVELRLFTGQVVVGKVTDNHNGSYDASFECKQLGKAKLLVLVNRQQIMGSPYSTVVCRNYNVFSSPPYKRVSNIAHEAMGTPWGVACGKNGVWAVADSSNHCVYVFDGHDQLVKKVTGFNSPHGVAFDTDNNLYVADCDNHRVLKYTVNGQYMQSFGRPGFGDGELRCPHGVTTHNGKVYVAECGTHRISVFRCEDGQFCSTFGDSHLSQPYDVAVNNINQLLVADHGHNCVSMYTLDGKYVGKFGAQLRNPCGIATDLNGFVLVSNSNGVSIFDHVGNFICHSNQYTYGRFCFPCGIALNYNGYLYVGEQNKPSIQIFTNY